MNVRVILGILIIGVLFPLAAMAATKSPPLSLGQVATNLMEPVNVVTSFVHTTCIIIGGAFVFAGIIKYFEHRRSPTMVPISTVFFLLIAGSVLIALPMISYISTHGFPYSLIRWKK